MKPETLNQLRDLKDHYPRLVKFVVWAVERLGLAYVDINDWQCNLKPGVYIHNRKNRFKIRRYCRCSQHDRTLALRFYNK